jgi:tape measure domain-containing protein
MAAQDAELKLKVSLDLAFFRQQLAGLGQAAAGTPMPVQIKFDRRSVQNELNTLGANIKRRNYTLNVNTNLKAEIENASKLAKALDELSRSRNTAQKSINQQLGLGVLMQGPQSGGLGSKDVIKLYRAAAQAGLLEYNKEIARTKASTIAALEEVGADSVRGLLNGLNSEDEKLRAAATYLGETLIKTVKNVLGIASPSREFKKIGQNVGEGFQQGMLSSMDKAFGAVEGLMRARMKVLDTIARGMFRMAGIDPVALRAEAAQRRALPGVNFPATVPPRNFPIGPSGTGRALPPGATPSALPGTAFGAQKYLPTALGEELKAILRGAAFAFVDSLKQQVRSVRVGLGATQQPLLSPSRIAGLLPAGVGRAPSMYSTGAMGGETRAEMMARREREARIRSDLRGMDVLGGGAGRAPSTYSHAYRSARPTSAIVPYASGGAIVPQPSMAGGGNVPPSGGGGFGGMGGFGGFGRALGNVPNLPGTGTIRELGSEFAFATKQVLLFGQAYKLLGVIQAFPAQVGAAVGQLQSFRNTLNAVTPSAEEARASNELLLGLMEKYNVPLQSARDGFTKLYASMAPAGFSGDEIRDLFTGITKAAATFGMSADKVDRVNYAFAQMASKGQVMSEELKGQLGDVLPGAMALFAEAAGFKGPKAIQDFSAALEDGAYKGKAMVALLKNVTVVMNKEFGPGAEGAALTFQGVMNRMQNSMTLLYESFEPVAVGFLNTVVVPMTNGIKQLTDGLNAFFTGTAAKTAGGFAIAQELERLRPAFDGIGQNVQKLVPVFQQFANVALNVAKVFLEIAGNPFVGYLLRVYAAVLPLTLALQVLNLQALIPMIASFVRSAYALTVFTVQCAKAGQAAAIAKLSFQTAGITLRTFFASTGVGLVLVGIGLLIERFTSMNQALEDTRNKALGAAQAIRSMSQTEARAAEQQAQTAYKTIGSVAGRQGPQQQGGDRLVPVSERELKQLQSLGAIREQRDPSGQIYVKRSQALSLAQQAQRIKSEAAFRQEQIKFEEKQAAMPVTIAPISGAASDGKGTKAAKEKKERESQVPLLQLQLATTKQLFDLERDILAARLGGNDLEVIRLEGLRQQLQINEEIAKINLEKDIPGQEKALQIERLRKQSEGERLRTAFEIEQKIQEVYSGISDAVTKIAQDSANELADKQSYEKLVSEGVLPSIAKITIETNRQFAVEAQKLSVLEAQIKDQIALLSAKEKISDEDQKQLNILKERLGIIQGGQTDLPGLAQEAMQARISGEQPLSGRVVALEEIESMRRELEKLTSWEYQAVQGAQAVGSALAEAMTTGVAGMISGTATAKEVFASFLQSVGQALSQAASQMIATYIAIGIAKMFAGLSGGGGNPAGSGGGISDSLPGIRQYAGGMGGGGAPGSMPFAPPAFANGGIVTGPTLSLIGEGRYNEAVVPLPNGRAIPVQINGERSARDLMGRNAPGMANAAPLTLKFESTKINGVEYVSREQLELAMAETRRASIAGGATRGMNMALDKIQQSPSTRSRIGIR